MEVNWARQPARGLKLLRYYPTSCLSIGANSRSKYIGAYALFVATAMALALSMRLDIAVTTGFPILDGGMFYAMVRDLQLHHLALPAFTTYNHAHIPFSYPPLGLYSAAIAQRATGVDLLSIVQYLPIIISVLIVGAFALLAYELVPFVAATTAVFAFAVLPNAFQNSMEGGGLTRAPGELFTLLFLHQLCLFLRLTRKRHGVLASAFLAGVLLSHLEWSLFALLSLGVFWLSFGHSRKSLVQTIFIASGALALAAPWWSTVLRLHGVAPFLSTMSGSSQVWPWYSSLVGFASLQLANEGGFPFVTALGLVGMVVMLHRRQWLLPVWMLSIPLTEARAWQLRLVIPLALLAGIAMESALLPLLLRGIASTGIGGDGENARGAKCVAAIVLGFMLMYGTLSGWYVSTTSVTSLTPGERSTMAWITRHTPRQSTFLIVRGGSWSLDAASEWFPALSGRVSVATVQGYEWIPGAFAHRARRSERLAQCVSSTAACIDRWLAGTRERVDYIFVSRAASVVSSDCCSGIRSQLAMDSHFQQVYKGSGGIILRVRSRGS